MSGRSPVTSARPRPNAPATQEKEEGKEARQPNSASDSSEATTLSWTRRAAMTRDAGSHVASVSGTSESRAGDTNNSKPAAEADGSSTAEDGGATSTGADAADSTNNSNRTLTRAGATSASPAGGTSNGDQVAADTPSSAVEGNGDLTTLKGKKVLKTMGPNRVVEGHVHGHVPAKQGQDEKWVLKWDDDDQEDEEVTRAELDKWINLHNVRTWSKGTKKRDRAVRPQASATPTKKTPKKRHKQAATPSPGVKRVRSRSPKVNGTVSVSPSVSPKTRSSTSSSTSSALKKKAKLASSNGDGRQGKGLQGNASDIGKLVAKVFMEGIFTGEVTKVKPGSSTYWSIRYEDDDSEDLDEKEMASCTKLYELLLAKFEDASGREVTQADEDGEKDDGTGSDEEKEKDTTKKEKGKGKGKAKGETKGGSTADEGNTDTNNLLGARVRKFFTKYGEFNGKVTKHCAPESEDELGDLWLIEYEDGDAEHMDIAEIREGKALYEKHYALERKEIEVPAKEPASGKKAATNIPEKAATCVFYAERPKDSRLFSKIKNYRKWRS